MTLFFVGGLKEIERLPCRRTRNYRIDDCPVREVVQNLEEPWERRQRIKQLKKRMRKTRHELS